jgi:hypothetical protein
MREASVVAILRWGEVHTHPYVFSSSSCDLSNLFCNIETNKEYLIYEEQKF